MNDCTWDYSKYADILNIHKKNEKRKGSIEVGSFTFDFNAYHEVVGVEIEHASEFLAQMDIEEEQAEQITDAAVIIDKRNPHNQLIFLMLRFQNVVKKIPVSIPLHTITEFA